MKRVLFVLKRREDYNAKLHSHIGLSTGLFNSASFMNDMLAENNVESKLVVVKDNNCIDREVTAYKPTHVIIEALWVVPQKFYILEKLHPTVKWIIRLHSEMPFMAGEGMAMDWLGDYSKFKNIIIATNAPRMYDEVLDYLTSINGWNEKTAYDKIIYLPNYYPRAFKIKPFNRKKSSVDIGCFGAIRPLKNHLVQAHAAIRFAESIGKTLNFHINAGRIEMNGQPALNNLKGLFEQHYDNGHRLINHTWSPREEFLKVCAQMDIGMQCNFSETFNIVGADIISQGVPLIGTHEIPWLLMGNRDPNSSIDIVDGLEFAYDHPYLNNIINKLSLKIYTSKTRDIWLRYFRGN